MTLSILDSIALALTMVVNMFVVMVAAAKGGNMRYTRGILQSVFMACFQALFLYAGVWIASLFRMGAPEYDKWLTAGVLVIMAVKLLAGVVKKEKVKDAIAITSFKSTLFLSIATSMNAFVVGMGMGFCFEPGQFVLSAVIIMAVGFLVSLVGVFIGRQNRVIPARMLVAVEALLLVEIAVKLFFELA